MKKITLILLVLTLAFFSGLQAQDLKFPRPSPASSISQTVGVAEVNMAYSRPGVKDRVIWGDLVPYDKVWRTGANEPTTIEFSTDVMLGDNKLTAGKYGLFTIPGKDEWTFIFSKKINHWQTYSDKDAGDVVQVKVKPMAASHCEWLRFDFQDLSADSAKVILHWEKLMVAFTFKVDTKTAILKKIGQTMGSYWLTPFRSANYAFSNDMFDKAKEWINVSTALNKVYWNMLLKAKIYHKMAKTKDETKNAIKILEETNMLIKELPEGQKSFATEGPKLLEEWTGKKK
jgi:hypothetical protein